MENMKSASRNIVVNPTFQEWMYEDEKHFTDAPIKRQITYREEIGLNPSEDPWKQRHDYGTKSARHGSSRALLVLVCILCVLSIAAIALNLLMFFGKLSYKCVCSADQLESVSAGALRSDVDILDRVKKLESNLTAIQEKLLTKANELQHLQVVLSSELSNTAEKLDRVNISILRLIGNVSSEIQDKLNLTEIKLQKSDSNLATSLDEVRKNLTAKINDTIAHVLDTETKLETSIESTNKTLNHKLNWTTQLLEAKDESILDTVGNINSSLHAKADAGFAELRITSADTKETISKINTTLLGRIVSEIEELNVDLNSTTSDLKASSIERDEILKTVNTTLVMKIRGLRIDTDQLSSSLSASQVNLEKLNLTLTNATAKIDSVDVLISQLSSSLATSQSNLAKVNETVLSNTQGLNSAKQTLMQEDINIRDLISAVNTTLSIKVENISKSQGPIGPRGFNGSLGATGERGPQGFNGTQGPHGDLGLPGFNGSQGPRGFIGPQGPQGAGNFSQCQHVSDSITGTQSPIASNSDASTQVSIREPSDKRIVGASCSTDIAQQYVLSVTPDPSGSLYACDCKGHYGLGAQTITCIIHYWQCPLKT